MKWHFLCYQVQQAQATALVGGKPIMLAQATNQILPGGIGKFACLSICLSAHFQILWVYILCPPLQAWHVYQGSVVFLQSANTFVNPSV